MMGLQIGQDESRTSRFTNQQSEKTETELVKGLREATNTENLTMIKATSAWPILSNNINFAGKADTQQQVEWQAELMGAPKTERAGRGKQLADLLAANQVNSHMPAVHAKYKLGNTKNHGLVAKWGKHYEAAARWEGFFLFIWKGLQTVETLTEAQKHRSEFMKLASYEELRASFVNNLPEMGALVADLVSTAFNIEGNAVFVAKPLLEANSKPEKRKSPSGIETKT